ncbi:chromate transporter [Arthrobacter sp. JUb119]|uniref:chromate efflux transporter n=1 Tax=Micrococcaceae TaxID=1268 RepID=UPI000CFB3E0D|nr:chromate efflux transporter [Arthrobacter sp. MYb222]MCS3492574.1 chromate transporter [Arthrobacter sp. JUb119]PQZ88311.1 chromate transporter [Arthrobacter sp. MYb222]
MEPQRMAQGSAREVFKVFLKLGLTSFGGPIAHLGYFRTELVDRRRWLDDQQYAQLVALSQFLPGPASSQVGFGLGLHRAGMRGALAAFLAFTLPSAVVMAVFAFGASLFSGPIGTGLLAGLKIVAVAIIAHAVLGMARNLAPDRARAAIAVVAAGSALLLAGSFGQVLAIAFGALAGYFWCRGKDAGAAAAMQFPVSRTVGISCLSLFAILLFGLPVAALATGWDLLGFIDAFYRSGALVFGGGHVVLPLLQSAVVDPGLISSQEFLAGYGAAQAMPGPLFTFAAYLGVLVDSGPGGAAGALIALLAIFLPGFLLLLGVLPFWNRVSHWPAARAIMHGANAAVVGVLAAALYNPVFTSAITSAPAFVLALLCFVLLTAWKMAPWIVVAIGALGGVLLGVLA